MSEFLQSEARVAMHMFAKDGHNEEDKATDCRRRKSMKIEPGRGDAALGYRSAYTRSKRVVERVFKSVRDTHDTAMIENFTDTTEEEFDDNCYFGMG